MTKKFALLLVFVVILGIGTGFALAQTNIGSSGTSGTDRINSSKSLKGQVFGIKDTSSFEKNPPEGVLKKGGKEGEGQYHLIRPGGESQTAYLTSSNIDFSEFVGRKVKVWGNSQQSSKVPWLLDVGRLQALE